MHPWDWEFLQTEINSKDYVVTDRGPLFGPVTGFTLRRDADLELIFVSFSANDSKSSAINLPAGSVYKPTAEVKLESRFGPRATAGGVIPRRVITTATSDNCPQVKQQNSTVHFLQWDRQDATEPCHIIEWVDNLSASFIWPDSDETNATGERRRTLRGSKGEVVLTTPIHEVSSHRTCVRLIVEGNELFVGVSQCKPQHIKRPGFILYRGTPDEATRSKIRDCLSFCLGNFFVYLGDTTFDREWTPIAFHARSGHALVKESPKLMGSPPAPLGGRFEWEITSELLGKMVSSLYRIYDVYDFQSVFWNYWHALAAPVHMTAAHFGAAIESLQKAYFKASGSELDTTIVTDEKTWKTIIKGIRTCITNAKVGEASEKILVNMAQNLNCAPQSVMSQRFFDALGIEIGPLEREVWTNRNRSAHGGRADSETGLRLIRENKVLHIMMNRILLALSGGGSHYYDYYNLGRPTTPLANPIKDDRSKTSPR